VSAGGIVAACPASGDRVERTPLRGVIFPDEASQPPSRPDAARVFAVGSVSAQLPRLGFALSSRMKLRSRHLAPVPHGFLPSAACLRSCRSWDSHCLPG